MSEQDEPVKTIAGIEQTKFIIIVAGVGALIFLILLQACCMICRDRKNRAKIANRVSFPSYHSPFVVLHTCEEERASTEVLITVNVFTGETSNGAQLERLFIHFQLQLRELCDERRFTHHGRTSSQKRRKSTSEQRSFKRQWTLERQRSRALCARSTQRWAHAR